MEAAVRWSPHSTSQSPRFLIVDVAGNSLKLCEIESSKKQEVQYKQVSERDKLPNFTAFDWSKTQETVVAIGSASGEASLVQISPKKSGQSDFYRSFPIKHQRKCNSIAFNTKDYLATGLDRVRNDFCMNIYDLNASIASGQNEPYKKLASSEAITSIKFFGQQPDLLVAGVARQCIRLYDLRDSTSGSVGQFPTRQVHNIAIDPLDENYFISAGPSGDPTVSVWDRRFSSRSSPAIPSDGSAAGPVLELRPGIDNAQSASIWSLRYSGVKRGCFGILSSSGEIKIVELAQHSMRTLSQTSPINHYGGSSWNSPHYTRVTHQLQYPYYDHHHPQDENTRVIAYDFVSPSDVNDQCAIALRQNRRVEFLNLPRAASHIDITALDELSIFGPDDHHVYQPSPWEGSVSADLAKLQQEASAKGGWKTSIDSADESAARLGKSRVENIGHRIPSATDKPSMPTSRDLHEELLTLGSYKPNLADLLKLQGIQRRRCQEGYLFYYQKNKEVLANDRWLIELWDNVKRFEDLAKDNGMVSESLDLSYLGVAAVWENNFGTASYANRILDDEPLSPNRFANAVKGIVQAKGLTPSDSIRTAFPQHRQLCLSICGWDFSKERLRHRCLELIDQGDYYRPIVWAVIKGYKDLALDLLRTLIKKRHVEHIGLGAVIACESVNEEQREMCRWMADEADDPYLKALLAYFISGDWKSATDMEQLSLADRLGVALRYLDDERLGEFIKLNLAEAKICGNIEGVVLTGLVDGAMDLFQRYITKFNDLQTAVLVMAVTNPRYMSDWRFELWKETYFMQMQSWQAFIERTRFVAQHNRKSLARDGRQKIQPAAPQVTLRCNHCMASLAKRSVKSEKSDSDNAVGPQKNPTNTSRLKASEASGVLCPHCGRHMPRCGVCMMWLGSPDPAKLGGAATLAAEEPMAKQILFCMNCTHGFHGHHAKDWFARHQMCPVPDCPCMCGLLH